MRRGHDPPTLNSCTREALEREPDGRYDVSPEATMDEDAVRETLSGEEFVFDIQGHLLGYDLNPTVNEEGANFWSLFPQKDCGAEDPRDCYTIEQFLELMFIRSDTSMVVISALPIAPEVALYLWRSWRRPNESPRRYAAMTAF